ncbi:MAG: N(4)-(beta-N-acetylglucosaminyl)-L-asparaginase [Phycisphaerae bacterium]|nr:N(4)-(beta-N-acetylglucosaminyl)-L-asparaginase [Phycisphaerae bacterium]
MPDRTDLNRRTFIQTTAAAIAGGSLLALDSTPGTQAAVAASHRGGSRPIVISSMNGHNRPKGRPASCIEEAMAILKSGGDPLDAVIAGVNIVEDDPDDTSVGLGGLPNEDGVVELDSSVMHGPTRKAGAVAALRGIRNPSKVAKLVMTRTDHVLIVGEGALRFARAHGFKEEDLLTEESRREWLKWRESHSDNDDWLSPESDTQTGSHAVGRRRWRHTYGTINCCAVNSNGDIAGVTTTSGLSYKIPGRVGDSPIIGAGLYVDNDVGAAGSTGRGEANLQNCSSFLVVELMRSGKSPGEACMEVMKRIADRTEPRLRGKQGRPAFNLRLYAVAKDGSYGSASMWSGPRAQFAVNDEKGARVEPCAFLFESDGTEVD